MVFGHVREFLSPELDEETRASLRPPAPEPMPWTAPNLMLIRRESFQRVGPFTTAVRVGVTVDWFARAAEAGLRYTILPEVVLERRLHTQNNGLRESAFPLAVSRGDPAGDGAPPGGRRGASGGEDLSRGRPRGSFWPSATQRALLEVGLGPEAKAPERWRALQPLDVTTLETGSFGLLPPLYERLHELLPDDPQLPRLFGTYRSVWYRNQLLLERLAVLLPLLRQRAGVQPLLVGGMSALLRWYPRLGLRPVPLLELIVEP